MMDEMVLKKALIEADNYIVDSYPDGKHSFSHRIEKRIRNLIAKEKHPVSYLLKSAAAMILFALLLGGTVVLGSSESARAAVFAWVSEIFEGTFLYRGTQDSVRDISMYSMRDLVSTEYEFLEASSHRNDDEIFEYYVDAADYLLCLQVFSARTGKNMQVFIDEGDDVKHVTLCGHSADFYYDKEGESHAYVWQDEYGTLFYIGGHIDANSITELAEAFVRKYE